MRAELHKASTGLYTASKLRGMFSLPVSVQRVQQMLQRVQHLNWEMMKIVPSLTPRDKDARLKWVREQLALSASVWQKAIWSDEKSFNLDGQDGFANYWMNKRITPRMFSRRRNGGGKSWFGMCLVSAVRAT